MSNRSAQPNKDFQINRHKFLKIIAAGVAAPSLQRAARRRSAPKARNVVGVHGLFADGSCWSEVVVRLQRPFVPREMVGTLPPSLFELRRTGRIAQATDFY